MRIWRQRLPMRIRSQHLQRQPQNACCKNEVSPHAREGSRTFAIMHTMKEKLAAFERLLTIMDELREQCPWDRKQTFESLRHLTIEETYELADAILDKDLDEIRKETGDLMLHMVFYARIASESEKGWDIADSLHGICDKLVSRHPHIYGDVKADDEETVKANWEALKLKEGNKSVLEGVPRSLASLVKAYRIQDKVRGVGFDFGHPDEAWKKVDEELGELQEADGDDAVAEEFGDVMFALINWARLKGINPDEALERTNRKFIARFQHMEQSAASREQSLSEMSLLEMDELWKQAKVELA
jgi:XTP/dITP diphosphohydrolase